LVANIAGWEGHNEQTPVEELVRLGLLAEALHNIRLQDMYVNSYVSLLYNVAGDCLLRSESGCCRQYNICLGSWDSYQGLIAEPILAKIASTFMWVEGFFRELPPGAERGVDTLHAELEKRFKGVHDLEAFHQKVKSYEKACLDNKGNALVKGGGKGGKGKDEENVEEAMATNDTWHIVVAQLCGKAGQGLLRRLMQQELMTYFLEYCGTTTKRQKGVCYQDAVILYNDSDDGKPIIQWNTTRSPYHNIYVGIPHPLTYPVLEEMIDEVEQVYQNTFWASFDAYEVCMAALALAKRGMNIESMFLLWGSGGVGLSLLTTHLEAVYTHELHRYFDPNIYSITMKKFGRS